MQNINSNSNIQVPMEIAKELGLLKGGGCGGGGSLCGKALSETAVNGGGATTSNFPSGPVFSVGQAAPPGEIHPVGFLSLFTIKSLMVLIFNYNL